MKNILCYGDSNTWGWEPKSSQRYSWDIRWPGVMAEKLGRTFKVIEEGLGGRTVCNEDFIQPGRHGGKMLRTILESHRPLDLVILMLGTNDLKSSYHMAPSEIARGVEEMVKLIKSILLWGAEQSPEILLVSPVHIGDNIAETAFGKMFGGDKAHKLSKMLDDEYQSVSQRYECAFFRASQVARASREDAVHMDRENHYLLGCALAEYIQKLNL